MIQHLLVVLLAGGVLIWFVPRGYAAMKAAIQRRPLPAAGWGILGLLGYLVALIVIVLAMVLLAILFGALGFGDLVGLDILGGIVAILGVTLAFVIACAYIADAIVGAALAGLIMREASATRSARVRAPGSRGGGGGAAVVAPGRRGVGEAGRRRPRPRRAVARGGAGPEVDAIGAGHHARAAGDADGLSLAGAP